MKSPTLRLLTLTLGACLAVRPSLCRANEPARLDMRSVLNTAWEDDGIPGNQTGGWSDEGANDMVLWPPLAAGRELHNGFPFDVVDPVQNSGKGVLLLAGKRGRFDLPEQVEIAGSNATGRYLYLLMNETLPWRKQGETNLNPVILTTTLRYADGSTHAFPLREGIEIVSWITSLARPLHKPPVLSLVHLGTNIIVNNSQCIGVWATRLENPSPQMPITSVSFRSHGLGVPCIFAATLSDTDYAATAVRPPTTNTPPPEGYFDAKRKAKDTAFYNQTRSAGFLQGVRASNVLRPDMVAITFDNALTHDAGASTNTTLPFHDPTRWTITSSDDPDYKDVKRPLEIGHKGFERYNGTIFPGSAQVLYWNEFYVHLPTPMKSGCHYTFAVDGMETGRFDRVEIVSSNRTRRVIAGAVNITDRAEIAYDDRNTITRALKVNQVGYSLSGKERWAYLGWWAGSLGPVDYAAFPAFEVIDEANGKSVLQGKTELRAPGRELHKGDEKAANLQEGFADSLPSKSKSGLGATTDEPSGEIVYQLDIGKLAAGRYHLLVPGLGRSETFRVGAEATTEAAYHTFRAFLHQRCGIELGPPCVPILVHDACHQECWESGYLVDDPQYTPKPGEAKRSFSGGYYDASDLPVIIADAASIGDALMVYECHPEFFTDGQFNLPESGKGIPDILSEAKWALKFWLENQLESGAIPDGRGNDNDGWRPFGGKRGNFGITPPTNESTPIYAAVAAQFSTLIRPYDKPLADRLINSARKALDYALLEKAEPNPIRIDPATKQPKTNKVAYAKIAWALAECYRATGDPKLGEKLATFIPYAKHQPGVNAWEWNGKVLWPLVRSPHPLPPGIVEEARKMLLDHADVVLRKTHEPAYRLGIGNYDDSVNCVEASIGWGLSTPGRFGDILARAHAITGEAKYLDALALNYDFLFGVNPMGKTFVCGMGWNPPWRPEIGIWFYRSPTGEIKWTSPSLVPPMITGITIYGLGPEVPYYPTANDSGGPWPLMHCHRDVDRGQEKYNEFTPMQTMGPTALMTLYLAVQDHAVAAKKQ